MGHYKEDYFEKLSKEALEKQGIAFTKITVKIGMATGHHQDVQVSVLFPKGEDKNSYQCQHSIFFKGMPTGCGLAVMHGHYYFKTNPRMDPVVMAMIDHYEKDGCAIMASIGGNEWQDCPWLKKWGFHIITAYRNLAHPGSNDYQSIWIRSVAMRDPSQPKTPLKPGEAEDDEEDDDDDDND